MHVKRDIYIKKNFISVRIHPFEPRSNG